MAEAVAWHTKVVYRFHSEWNEESSEAMRVQGLGPLVSCGQRRPSTMGNNCSMVRDAEHTEAELADAEYELRRAALGVVILKDSDVRDHSLAIRRRACHNV